MALSPTVNVVTTMGSGPRVLLASASLLSYLTEDEKDSLRRDTSLRCTFIEIKTPPNLQSFKDFLGVISTLHMFIEGSGNKSVVFIGDERDSPFGIGLSIFYKKVVRHLVMVNPIFTKFEPKASFLKMAIDRVEKWLPLGLPLRGTVVSFQIPSFLHRVRVPTLVLDSERNEGNRLLLESLPTGFQIFWQKGELLASVLEFFEVPAKCPMKNRLVIVQHDAINFYRP
jgi:hypothetical protein